MGFLNIFKNREEERKKKALLLGFKITYVTRECPFFSKYQGKLEKLEACRCARYALNRQEGTSWSLLQRDKEHGAQLPGYLVTGDNVTHELIEALRPLAEQFGEEFYEFEATDSEIAVFWTEWGGVREIEEIYNALNRVRSL